MRILVADDEEYMRNLVVDTIRTLPLEAEFIACSDGNEATMRLKEDPDFAIIFTDWNMGGGGGEQVVKIAMTLGIPIERIVVITGYGITSAEAIQNQLKAEGYGIGRVLFKPFHIAELLEIVKQLI